MSVHNIKHALHPMLLTKQLEPHQMGSSNVAHWNTKVYKFDVVPRMVGGRQDRGAAAYLYIRDILLPKLTVVHTPHITTSSFAPNNFAKQHLCTHTTPNKGNVQFRSNKYGMQHEVPPTAAQKHTHRA